MQFLSIKVTDPLPTLLQQASLIVDLGLTGHRNLFSTLRLKHLAGDQTDLPVGYCGESQPQMQLAKQMQSNKPTQVGKPLST